LCGVARDLWQCYGVADAKYATVPEINLFISLRRSPEPKSLCESAKAANAVSSQSRFCLVHRLGLFPSPRAALFMHWRNFPAKSCQTKKTFDDDCEMSRQ
jgi:hypothetical protein